MQTNRLDYVGTRLGGQATGELPKALVTSDPTRARRAYVASRAGFDETSLALGAHGLLALIDQMFDRARPYQTDQRVIPLTGTFERVNHAPKQ
jgi:hypothetical protein